MKRDLLNLLKCSYCGADLKIKEIFSENEEGIINGYLTCECTEYPILEGILILKDTPDKECMLNYLKNKKIEKAIAMPFINYCNDICRMMNFLGRRPFGNFINKCLLIFVEIYSKRKYRKYSNKNLVFFELLGNTPYQNYLKHRFSSQTLWTLYPFIELLRKKQKRVLDVCCGAGHGSFVISKYVHPDELICIDKDFDSLFLAKKYFSTAEFINLDVNCQLPFKDNIFSSVLVMDAFHTIDSRALLAKELERVLSKEGILLLLHLHNALRENMFAGKPLSPSAWKKLFNELNMLALPERSVIDDFISRDELDLSTKYSEQELNSSDVIIMIAGNNSDYFGGVWRDILDIKNNLIINPIYKMEEEKDKILLIREFPSESFRREVRLTEKYLPERCEIDKRFVEGRSVHVSELNKREIEDLMKKFIIINVPEYYI